MKAMLGNEQSNGLKHTLHCNIDPMVQNLTWVTCFNSHVASSLKSLKLMYISET
jgi:hypothetical protein